jgi:hypothetical protein
VTKRGFGSDLRKGIGLTVGPTGQRVKASSARGRGGVWRASVVEREVGRGRLGPGRAGSFFFLFIFYLLISDLTSFLNLKIENLNSILCWGFHTVIEHIKGNTNMKEHIYSCIFFFAYSFPFLFYSLFLISLSHWNTKFEFKSCYELHL